MFSNRLTSVARCASSMNSRSPLLLAVAMRAPKSKVDFKFLAREQFSATILACLSSSAFFLAASAASFSFFFFSSSASLPDGLAALAPALAADAPPVGAEAAAVAATAVAAVAVAVAAACSAALALACAPAGRLNMLFSGTSEAGAWSLNIRRPSLSVQAHWAIALAEAKKAVKAVKAITTKRSVEFIRLSVACLRPMPHITLNH